MITFVNQSFLQSMSVDVKQTAPNSAVRVLEFTQFRSIVMLRTCSWHEVRVELFSDFSNKNNEKVRDRSNFQARK